jgi:hypothetical protein
VNAIPRSNAVATTTDLVFTDPNVHRPLSTVSQGNTFSVTLTCPHCGRAGTFSPISNVHDAKFDKRIIVTKPDGTKAGESNVEMHMGVRSCPNTDCRCMVSVLYSIQPGQAQGPIHLLWTAPPQLIDFRTNNIPSKIVESIKEMLAAHSVGAFRASALMVRRSLELLCQDKSVPGKDLKERLANLASHVVISPALLVAATELRILGNDAAHVEAKAYDDIDEEHAETAIELAREILKAVYQHDDLVARLTRLKKAP